MPPLYDLTSATIPLTKRTAKVKALGEPNTPVFQGEQMTAESLLGLGTPVYTTARDVERVALAIVEQLNYQVAQGVDPLFMSAASSAHSKQSDVYRDRFLSPRAVAILAEVAAQYPSAGKRWQGVFTSHRTGGNGGGCR